MGWFVECSLGKGCWWVVSLLDYYSGSTRGIFGEFLGLVRGRGEGIMWWVAGGVGWLAGV